MNYLKALAAYVLWGIFPLYWKLLSSVGSLEVICHRIIWSLVTLVLCISLLRQWPDIAGALRNPKRFGLTVVAAVLISINWLVFIWAVQHDAIIESSLGYFINPLLNVLLGVMIFGERLRRIQWAAVAIAMAGLIIMTVQTGSISWIALSLAISFALYAAVKKKTSLPAIAGLGMETAVLMPVALGYVTWCTVGLQDIHSSQDYVLLALGGPITTLPLVLFAAAAKTVPLAIMGMLQYIGPSIQFVLGIWLYQEPVSEWRILGFSCVWIALALLSIHAFIQSQRSIAKPG